MDLDQYRIDMAAAHKRFQDNVYQMLVAYGQVQTVFTNTLQNVERGFADVKESNEELRRLILEQGQQLREQGQQIRDLRERLNGGAR